MPYAGSMEDKYEKLMKNHARWMKNNVKTNVSGNIYVGIEQLANE